MLSWDIRDVTRLRRRACLWEEERFRWRYLRAPPAIARIGGSYVVESIE